MSELTMKPVSFLDSTLQLRWELKKEEFDNCAFQEKIHSPEFTVQIGSEVSEWVITIYPKGDEEIDRDKVVINLVCFEGDKDLNYSVIFDIRLETPSGYWPDDFVKKLFSKRSEHTPNDFDPEEDHTWGFAFTSTEKFREQFVDDKIIIVATLVIDMEGKGDRNHMTLADEFTRDMRSLSVYEDLYDFTIICDGKHFPCHKLLLMSRSEFFRGMFRNNKNKKDTIVDDSSPEIVKTVLKFMMNGLLPKNIDAKAKEIIHLADMYGLKGLTEACIVSIVKNLSPDNATESLTIVDKHAPKSEHRSKILDYIKKEASQIVKTQHWKQFVQNYPDLITDIVLTNHC